MMDVSTNSPNVREEGKVAPPHLQQLEQQSKGDLRRNGEGGKSILARYVVMIMAIGRSNDEGGSSDSPDVCRESQVAQPQHQEDEQQAQETPHRQIGRS